MQSFPMFIRTTGREVVIVGGGEQAAQKARLALKTDACIRVVADELDPELAGLASKGRVEQVRGEVSPEVFRRAALVFVATGCPGADVAFHGLAKAAGALVNVVDRPELCDATTPSIVDRDPVVVAIGTEGTAPVLGRLIKTQIETLLHPRLGALSALAGRLRYAVQKSIPRDARRAFWAWVFKDEPGLLFRQGEEDTAIRLVKAAIKRGGAPTDAGKGHIALVG
ncbi:MAG: bifunctional precorrin-2 dehydrogenase/sirohydrochlorin ferrochelatase, partial [Pseudomonadota bacterium]